MQKPRSDNPYSAPEDANASPPWLRYLLGVGTGLYALVFGCGCLPTALLPLALPEAAKQISTLDWVNFAACTFTYLLGFAPALIAFTPVRHFRVFLLGWSLLVILVELVSTSWLITQATQDVPLYVCTSIVFLAWPVLCLMLGGATEPAALGDR